MTDVSASWAPQQLAEFLGAVSECVEEAGAAREGVERAAEAVEAECAALLRDGAVVASVGWPRFEVPERRLAEVVAGRADRVHVPGAGPCPALSLALDDGAGPGSSCSPARASRSPTRRPRCCAAWRAASG
jgi:hypothetical protein